MRLVKGQKQGYGKIYYENSNVVKIEGEFQNNMLNGPGIKFFDENGKLKLEGYFENNCPARKCKFYFPSGKVKYEGELNENLLFHGKNGKEYRKTGDLKFEGSWIDGQLDGPGIKFYKGNKLINSANYEKGKAIGKVKTHYETGELLLESKYEENLPNDEDAVIYFKSGRLLNFIRNR